jgi:hypothetical protein
MLEKWAGLAATLGGVFYVSFWVGSVLSIDAAWALTLSWHAVGILLLAVGVVGLQLLQAHTPRAWLGWGGLALILLGLVSYLELLMIGTLIFGLAVVLTHILPRPGGVLLGTGAAMFLIVAAFNGPFWSEENPQPPLIPSVVFITALVLIGLGWVVLGWSRRSSPP